MVVALKILTYLFRFTRIRRSHVSDSWVIFGRPLLTEPSSRTPVGIYRFHVLGRLAHPFGFPTYASRILCRCLRAKIYAQVRPLSAPAASFEHSTIFAHSFGIFRLTDPPGLQTILNCHAKEAFHPHPDIPIYTVRHPYLFFVLLLPWYSYPLVYL